MVPAYDHDLIWDGHASMVHEIQRQLPEGVKPAAIFCSVGGGGLAMGVMTGLESVGWDDGKFLSRLSSFLVSDNLSSAARCS